MWASCCGTRYGGEDRDALNLGAGSVYSKWRLQLEDLGLGLP